MNITAKGLTKIYGSGENRVVALDKADLQIASKEFISIMGPSGSGKSTLLHLLSGLDRPSSGSLTYDGRDIYSMGDRELSAFRRRRIGFVFQQFNLLPVLTARENIIMPLLLDKKQPEEAYVKRLTDVLGLGGRLTHLPGELSGGQQQRVLIARALCATSRLLILDEPITGLDPAAIQDFYQMIRRLNREDGVAILMVSHDLRNAVEEANKILHLQKQVLFYGPAHDYMNSQAAGHFFHEKEQGKCKPTAGCHAVHLQTGPEGLPAPVLGASGGRHTGRQEEKGGCCHGNDQ